jgi:hypothetical protein
MSESVVWIASFDIGKKNFSFYIEEINYVNIQNISTIPIKDRYKQDGSVTELFEPILKSICQEGKKILLENHDITQDCESKQYLDPKTFHNMNELLDKYQEYWDQCDIFVIEKQMSFGKKHNTMALKLGQHCWSYFSIHYGLSKQLLEFPAYYKTQILGSIKDKKVTKGGKVTYKAVEKPERKKWCINKGLEILEERGDEDTISIITKSKKKDDLCDVICQLQAFKVLKYVDKNEF